MAERSVSVRLRAEVSQFRSDMASAGKAAADAANRAETSWNKSSSGMGKMANRIEQNADALDTVGGAAATTGAAILAVGAAVAKTGISYNSLQQTSRAALTSLLGSAAKANQQMDKLDAFARTSPFAKDVFIKAQQQMLAFGIAADDVVPILDAVQNAVAAAGGSNADIEAVVATLSKMSSTGKITAEDLNELGNRGINAAELIGASMGKTGAQIREDITAGALGADQAIALLTEGMSTRFEGAAANVKETIGGAFDRVKAAWRDLSSELMTPLVDPNGGGFGVDILNWTADAMRSFQALPEPVRNTTAALAGLGGAGLTAAGGFMMLAPRIVETMKAQNQLRESFPKTTTAIDRAGKAAGIAALAWMAWQASDSVLRRELGQTVPELEKINSELIALAKNAPAANASFGDESFISQLVRGAQMDITKPIRNVNDALGLLNEKSEAGRLGMDRFSASIKVGQQNVERADEGLRAYDQGLTDLVNSGKTDLAQQAFAQMAKDAEASGVAVEFTAAQFPEYRAALEETANQLEVTNLSEQDYINWMQGNVPPAVQKAVEAEGAHAEGLAGVGGAAEAAAESLDELIDRLNTLSGTFISSEEAQIAYQERLQSITDAVAENGRTLDINTAAGRANRTELLGLAEDGLALVEAQARMNASERELQNSMQTTFDDLVRAAQQMGYNETQAVEYARDLLGIPDDVPTDVYIKDYAKAVREAAAIDDAVQGIEDKTVTIAIKADTSEYDQAWRNLMNESWGKEKDAPGPWKSGYRSGRYHGGIDVKGMAAGGVMSVAQMVKPGEIRFAGDRSDVDEAWIPLDGSKRSIDILMEAIRRMPGFGEGMAAGGVTGEGSAVAGIPVPDTTPITSVWQAMFDQMLATTTAGWQAQTALWATSTQAIQATTLASQAAILSATQAHMGQMTGTYQTALTGMSTLVGAQYALMQSTVNSSLAAQRGDTQAAYQQMAGILATSLSLMAQTNAAQWQGMRSTQHGHLAGMQANSNQGFTTIRVHGIDQMAALAAGIGAEFGRAPGYVRGGLNEVRDVLNDFADAVNEAFGEIGVELPKVPGFYTGGPIPGQAASDTADNVLIRATPGEFMVRRPAVRALEREHPGALEHMNATGTLPYAGAYAGGGMVALDAAAKWLQAQGVRITEFGYWGQRVGGHSNRSYHYKPPGQAFDANAGPGGQNPIEMAIFDRLVPQLNSMWPGLRTLWRVANHFNHLHVDTGGSGGAGAGAMGGLLGVLGGNMPADMSKAYSMAAEKKGKELRDKFTEKLPDGLPGQMGSAVMDLTVKSLVAKAGEFGKMMVEPDGDVPGGDKVMRWRPTVIQALQRAGLPTTEDYINAWLRQIRSESGGNPSIRQQIRDVNSGGNEAQGLVQVIPGTFAAFRDPSLPNDRNHPLANLVAGMNWAKFKARRQGRDMLSFIGHGHGYETGTHSAASGWALVGENGPEYVKFNGGEQVANAQQSRAMSLAAISQPARMGGLSVGELKAAFAQAIRENPTIVQNVNATALSEKRLIDRTFEKVNDARAMSVAPI